MWGSERDIEGMEVWLYKSYWWLWDRFNSHNGSETGICTSSTGGGGVMISPPGRGTTPSTGWVMTCSTSSGTAT
jgi:hypothetical protein